MIAQTPVDRVVELLTDVGYCRIPTPIGVAGLKFELPAAFVGMPPSPDLILIVDTAYEDERRILKKVEGIARAMDVVGSKRPLTVILVGPRPTSGTLEFMSRVCRILPIGIVIGKESDEALRNWLAILMPLSLPEPSASIADPLAVIAMQLRDLDPEVASLVDFAQQGADMVQARLHALISDPLTGEIAEEEL